MLRDIYVIVGLMIFAILIIYGLDHVSGSECNKSQDTCEYYVR